jgi:hypothetical protein
MQMQARWRGMQHVPTHLRVSLLFMLHMEHTVTVDMLLASFQKRL